MAAPKARGDLAGCETPTAFALLHCGYPGCVVCPPPRRVEVGILEKTYPKKIIDIHLVDQENLYRNEGWGFYMSRKNNIVGSLGYTSVLLLALPQFLSSPLAVGDVLM